MVVAPEDLGRFLAVHRAAYFGFHNGAFDFAVINKFLETTDHPSRRILWDLVDAGHVFDTLVLEYLDQSLDKTNPYRVRFGELVGWSKTQLEGGLALYQADQRAQRAAT